MARSRNSDSRTFRYLHLWPGYTHSESWRTFLLFRSCNTYGPCGPTSCRNIHNDTRLYDGTVQKRYSPCRKCLCWTLCSILSAIDTDFTDRLCVVNQEGKSKNIQEDIVRARYRESLSNPRHINPYKVYNYHIDLGPLADRITAGNSIRVNISSSDFPQWDRNLNTGGTIGFEGALSMKTATQTILHTESYPSHLSLTILQV